MKDTVAIIGSHPKTRNDFDFNRNDCDVWVFNECISNNTFPYADIVFQMHLEAIWRNPENRNDKGHVKWLKEQTDTRVVMQDKYSDVPMSERFPLEEIVEHFKISYFTSSVAYALALACYWGYKRIELYGVEMETNTEYQYQRDGVTLWLGVALGLGIDVDAHITIFDQPLYGYEGEATIPYEKFDERINELVPQAKELAGKYKAMVLDFYKAVDIFAANSGTREEQALYAQSDKVRKAGAEIGLLDGRIQENQRYKKKADTMRDEARGEFMFSRQEFESAAKGLTDKYGEVNTSFISVSTTLQHIHDNIKRAAKGSPKRKKMTEAFKAQAHKQLELNNLVAVYQGAAQENYDYMAYLDKHIRAAGGAKSEAVLLERMQHGIS